MITEDQKTQIAKLRGIGYGYNFIARKLCLTKDQVSSYCKRNGLASNKRSNTLEYVGDFCRNCGTPLIQLPGMKKRKFCTKECRIAWWQTHPERVNRKAYHSVVCANCGSEFIAFGKSNRKYCSHDCYIAKRFGHGK